jgi:hypothetical protein
MRTNGFLAPVLDPGQRRRRRHVESATTTTTTTTTTMGANTARSDRCGSSALQAVVRHERRAFRTRPGPTEGIREGHCGRAAFRAPRRRAVHAVPILPPVYTSILQGPLPAPPRPRKGSQPPAVAIDGRKETSELSSSSAAGADDVDDICRRVGRCSPVRATGRKTRIRQRPRPACAGLFRPPNPVTCL